MRETARLIIPFWGITYLRKLVNVTIPALLAPGNLPALAESFDVEIILCTERLLFPMVEETQAFKNLSRICRVELRSIDDILTGGAGDYGVVLSYALYRGFTDLGARMTETWLLFLNADFILSDGSYRTLARLMKEGKRVIHSPSFRAVLEDVMPILENKVDPVETIMSMPSREMVGLALKHQHLTVRARTINQNLCHQWRMDQYYWSVDEQTLIGYQWPIALVAIKPERVLTEPTLMWDYAFVPDAAPTLPRYFISDSDDFFMIETQQRSSGEEMIRLGTFSPEVVAADLSMWTTKEQRECGQQLLVFHARDLPPNTEAVVAESRAYIADITRRLSPPEPHVDHPLFNSWFKKVQEKVRSGEGVAGLKPTLSLIEEYRGLGSSYSLMSPNPKKLTRRKGSGVLGVSFVPQATYSVLRIRVCIHAFSYEENDAVVAIFQQGRVEPVKVVCQHVGKRCKTDFDFTFDLPLKKRDILSLEVRIGPTRPGTLYINGPKAVVSSDAIPYISIVDLGEPPEREILAEGIPELDRYQLIPTGAMRLEYRNVATVSTVQTKNPTEAKIHKGASVFETSFVPLNPQSTLRINVCVNAYADQANDIVIAIFQKDLAAPLKLVSKEVAAREQAEINVTFDIVAGTSSVVEFEVCIGPAKPGNITVNGSGGAAKLSYMSVVDLGDIGIAASERDGNRPSTIDESVFAGRFLGVSKAKLKAWAPWSILKIARWLWSLVFGYTPELTTRHPLWLEMHTVVEKIRGMCRQNRGAILWIGSSESSFKHWLTNRVEPGLFYDEAALPDHVIGGGFDLAFCDLTIEEAIDFKTLYDRVRPYVKTDGSILLYVHGEHVFEFKDDDTFLLESLFLYGDEVKISFLGDAYTTNLRRLYYRGGRLFVHIRLLNMIARALTICALLPLTWAVNLRAKRLDPQQFKHRCTGILVEFQIRRDSIENTANVSEPRIAATV